MTEPRERKIRKYIKERYKGIEITDEAIEILSKKRDFQPILESSIDILMKQNRKTLKTPQILIGSVKHQEKEVEKSKEEYNTAVAYLTTAKRVDDKNWKRAFGNRSRKEVIKEAQEKYKEKEELVKKSTILLNKRKINFEAEKKKFYESKGDDFKAKKSKELIRRLNQDIDYIESKKSTTFK
jgi:hypothetical protein